MEDSAPINPAPSPSRKVALWVWVFPLVFSLQWIAVALRTPAFLGMWDEFGSKLPAATQVLANHWLLLAVLGFAPLAITLVTALKQSRRCSITTSLVIGFFCMLIAQWLTICQLLPIFQLSAVAGGG